MSDTTKYIVGTSGYSFVDWVGEFYPPETRGPKMLDEYVKHFAAVEVNYTFYRMPTARTLASMDRRTPPGFAFWVKANQIITHEHDRKPIGEFIDNLTPLRDSDKLAGVLLQFPQSFHRTVDNRKHLAGVIDDFAAVPTAVEFRHVSWEHPSTAEGLRQRNATLVVPDVPDIDGLFHCPAAATSRTGYLRLHSRNAGLWYAGAAERYDYSYTDAQLRELLDEWSRLEETVDRTYAFFNNCHRGQAAQNAEAFRRILGQIRIVNRPP